MKISVYRHLTCSNRGGGATSETSWRSDGRHRSTDCLAAVRVHELMCTATGTRARAGSVDCIQACMPSPCAMDLYRLCFKAICLTQTDPVDFDQDQRPEAPPDRKVDDVDPRRRIQSRLCSAKEEEEDTRRREEEKNEQRHPAAAVRRSDGLLRRRRGEHGSWRELPKAVVAAPPESLEATQEAIELTDAKVAWQRL